MQLLGLPAILIILAIAFIALTRPKPTFVIQIEGQDVFVVKGKAPPRFLQDCKNIAQQNRLSCGVVSGYLSPHRKTLQFSDEVPHDVRQAFRNSLAL